MRREARSVMSTSIHKKGVPAREGGERERDVKNDKANGRRANNDARNLKSTHSAVRARREDEADTHAGPVGHYPT